MPLAKSTTGMVQLVKGGGGDGNCAWLRRQAIITGSPYWWNRYQTCLYY
jgi:hypothetical protein